MFTYCWVIMRTALSILEIFMGCKVILALVGHEDLILVNKEERCTCQ
jgi:hypothetical protein